MMENVDETVALIHENVYVNFYKWTLHQSVL